MSDLAFRLVIVLQNLESYFLKHFAAIASHSHNSSGQRDLNGSEPFTGKERNKKYGVRIVI